MLRVLRIVGLGYLFLLASVVGRCPNNCSGHGNCDKLSRCDCGEGFQGADCSERTCAVGPAWVDLAEGIDDAHNSAECSNKGICDRTSGQCICQSGFIGRACERLSCPNDCSNRGKCMAMNKRATYSRDANSMQYTYSTVWDASMIQGCVCDPGFSGYDCSERTCPNGDDPLTTGQVNEVQLVLCLATAGSFALYFQGLPSGWIESGATADIVKNTLEKHPLITAVDVTFSPGHTSICATTNNVVTIEFTQDFGPLPPLVPLTDIDMQNVGGSVQVSANGHTPLVDSSGAIYNSIVGTKEAALCSNRGTCDRTSGMCSCFQSFGDMYDSSDGYGGPGLRGDCGWVRSSTAEAVSSCPSDVQCSGHGTCNGTALVSGGDGSYTCACSAGWSAGDCSERSCPLGLSWFDYPTSNEDAHNSYAECSYMGLCDRSSGQCVCREQFFGAACEYLNCAKDGGYDTCSGHGKCMSMAQLALVATVNGDLAGSFTYGTDPNKPSTWDADRVLGCLCDEGYGGFDCSLRLCPSGDDPGTYDDHSEVQLLRCTATDGFLTLTFRDKTTAPIYANYTAAMLRGLLGAVSSLSHGNVSVYFSADGDAPNSTFFIFPPQLPDLNVSTTASPTVSALNYGNSSVCSSSGSQIVIIEFNGISGDVPALRPSNTYLRDSVNGNGDDGTGTVDVYTDGQTVSGLRSVKGSTENDVCNNRGLCDLNTGWCECFKDWGSSDGRGNVGGRGDCGHRRDGFNPVDMS